MIYKYDDEKAYTAKAVTIFYIDVHICLSTLSYVFFKIWILHYYEVIAERDVCVIGFYVSPNTVTVTCLDLWLWFLAALLSLVKEEQLWTLGTCS